MKPLLAFAIAISLWFGVYAHAQDVEVNSRHVRHYVQPTIPDFAKHMGLKGVVRLEVEIAPSGKVNSVKPIGGHPVLVQAATQAVRNWEFNPSKDTTTGIVALTFN